jgi:hypothetical protein
MSSHYGPWATSIDAGRNPQLSTFWRRRMKMLVPASRSNPSLAPRHWLWLAAAALLALVLPTIHLVSAEEPAEKDPAKQKEAAKKAENNYVGHTVVLYGTRVWPPSDNAVMLPCIYSDLNRPDVRKELKLTNQQEKKLLEISRACHKRLKELYAAFHKEDAATPAGDEDAKRRKYAPAMAKLGNDVCQQVESLLTPEQLASLRSLILGRSCARLALQKGLQKKIGITEQQSQELANTVKEQQRQAETLVRAMRGIEEKTLAVLTPQQWKQLEQASAKSEAEEPFVFPGTELTELLRPEVQKQLGLSAEQLAKVHEMLDQVQSLLRSNESWKAANASGKSTKQRAELLAAFNRKMVEMTAKNREQVQKLLTEPQSTALKTIVLHRNFITALEMAVYAGIGDNGNKRPGLLGRIDLSPEQWRQVDQLQAESARMMREYSRAAGDRVLKVLTQQQRAKLFESQERGVPLLNDIDESEAGSAPKAKGDKTGTLTISGSVFTASSDFVAAKAETKDADSDKKALDEFHKLYSLKEGEVWKRIAPPFSPARAVYWRTSHPPHLDAYSASHPPTSMSFTWHDGALDLSGWSCGGSDLFYPLWLIARIHRQEIEGDVDLLRSDRVIGDWICRKGVSKQEMIAGLEKVLNRDCGLHVRLSLRDVKRQVFVAQGEFQFQALPGVKSEYGINLYDKETPGRFRSGQAHGTLEQFISDIGPYVRIRTASEVKNPPKDTLTWSSWASQEHPQAKDVKDRDAANVLKHVTDQTGLTFKEETRTVSVLFVEEVK